MKLYRVAIEEIEPGHFVAWVLDLLGCFASGETDAIALAAIPDAIKHHHRWLEMSVPVLDEMEIAVDERFHLVRQSEDAFVNAFFIDDAHPLDAEEVQHALDMLTLSRADLLTAIGGHDADVAVSAIMRHVAQLERWYGEHLGLKQPPLPDEPNKALEQSRVYTRRWLPSLIGDDRIFEHAGERWSARKITRRLIWHEREHSAKILTLFASQT